MHTSSAIKRGLLVFGSFAIAYNLSVLLHELCHLIPGYITNGSVGHITVHPFSWSYSFSSCSYPLLKAIAGPVGAIVFGVLLYLLLSRWLKTFLLPLLLVGPLVLIQNGGYLVIDTLMKSGGDACDMVRKGISPFIIIAVGVLFLISGIILVFHLFRKTGLLSDIFKYRLITLAIGVIPYLLAMLTWHLIYNRGEIILWSTYVIFGSVLAVVIAAIPVKSQNIIPKRLGIVPWKSALSIDLLAIIFIVFLLHGPLSGAKIYADRPRNFPSVMTASSYAENPNYIRWPGRYCILGYNIPESISPDEIRSYLMDLHRDNGYVLLKHDLSDPDIAKDNAWKESSYNRDEDPVVSNKEIFEKGHFKTKSCRQTWLNIDAENTVARICIRYFWKNEKFDGASVSQFVAPLSSTESLINYATLHPDEISPQQLEYLKSQN